MAKKQHLGLRQVRALKAGEIVWDPSLPCFGARRQRSDAISYVLFYRTKEGRQRWFTIGRHGAPWTPETARAQAKACWLISPIRATLPPRNVLDGTPKRLPSCATYTLLTRTPAGSLRAAARPKGPARLRPTADAYGGTLNRSLAAVPLPASHAKMSKLFYTTLPPAKRPVKPKPSPVD
jgi:hypothetical protein